MNTSRLNFKFVLHTSEERDESQITSTLLAFLEFPYRSRERECRYLACRPTCSQWEYQNQNITNLLLRFTPYHLVSTVGGTQNFQPVSAIVVSQMILMIGVFSDSPMLSSSLSFKLLSSRCVLLCQTME